ncbi:uncharacterized protein LOC128199969 isoform X2 [Galleria mellonella]|nr:uncharacterized protein LOC128199969 isoform X2 [Galleria mellonella]XP_052758294.1 uncharacterized protein LOC128199969 isoform X2 [Galleria mellonella]
MKTKRIKSKLKTDGEFIPPDGGWGWMIIFAAGISNLSTLPILQQFGLLCRDKLARLGISSSETTTILNMNFAMTSCAGLINGPMFKTFSYRQVSLTGAIIVFISLMLTTFSYNFITYLVFFSILYGFGYGISSSANALALNTYWKDRRRLATGLSWTITGLGPVVWPHIVTTLFVVFGETGTVLILSGISLHAIACALLLQPIEWHSEKPNAKEATIFKLDHDNKSLQNEKTYLDENKLKESGYDSPTKNNLSAFSSQYLYNEKHPINAGIEIIDPEIPISVCPSDSQSIQSRSRLSSIDASAKYTRQNSKKHSVTNLSRCRSRESSILNLKELKINSTVDLGAYTNENDKFSNSIKLNMQIPESEKEDLIASQNSKIYVKAIVENIDSNKVKDIENRSAKSIKSLIMNEQHEQNYSQDSYNNIENDSNRHFQEICNNQSYNTKHRKNSNNFNYDNELLKQASVKLQYLKDNNYIDNINLLSKNNNTEDKKEIEDKQDITEEKELTFSEKIYMYFDLDLLKDFTYINLMLGITLSNFNELNFSVLTPFILGDHGFSKTEVAYYMSLLAGIDISVRFCTPFVASKIGWDNNTFYLIGVIFMAMGRVVLAHFESYNAILLVAVIVGFGKGMRTVFMALVLPTHVPLHKLPGATGLQLLTAGIVYLTLGPVVGWIKDNASTAVTLHCLNIFTWLTVLSWTLEKYYRSRKQSADTTTGST